MAVGLTLVKLEMEQWSNVPGRKGRRVGSGA